MFEFFNDMNNYDSRKVDRYENGDILISTAIVSDGSKPYETAIQHPEYNDGSFVIVEAYDNREDAERGHSRWVSAMTSDNPPDFLQDCQNAGVASFLDADNLRFPRMRKA